MSQPQCNDSESNELVAVTYSGSVSHNDFPSGYRKLLTGPHSVRKIGPLYSFKYLINHWVSPPSFFELLQPSFSDKYMWIIFQVKKKHIRVSHAHAVISVSFPCPVHGVRVGNDVVVCNGAEFVAMRCRSLCGLLSLCNFVVVMVPVASTIEIERKKVPIESVISSALL